MVASLRDSSRLPHDATRRALPWIILLSVLGLAIGLFFAFRPVHPRVAVVGDSITVFAANSVKQDLGGSTRLHIDAKMGKRIDEMLPALKQEVAEHPRVVVVNLGTNDVLQAQTHPNWQPAFVRMVGMLAKVPCVGITTISTMVDGPTAVPSVANDINAAILSATASHSNFHILDWNGAVHAPGGTALLWPDHIHPTGAGSLRLAAMIDGLVHHGCDTR